MRVDAAIGHHRVGAELLESRPAVRAGATGINETTDADEVPDLEFLHRAAGGRDAADDFVAWHGRILSETPLVADEVQVGVADAAIEDLDLDVGGGRLAALDNRRAERGGGAGGGVGFGGKTDGFGHGSGRFCVLLISED